MLKFLQSRFLSPILHPWSKLYTLISRWWIIFFEFKTGLYGDLKELSTYCDRKELKINFQKMEVLIFFRRQSDNPWGWTIKDRYLIQIPKYSFPVIHMLGSSNKRVSYKSSKVSLKITTLPFDKFVPAAIKLFKSKVLGIVQYESQIYAYKKPDSLNKYKQNS